MCLNGTNKRKTTMRRIVDILAQIRTGNLLNTGEMSHRLRRTCLAFLTETVLWAYACRLEFLYTYLKDTCISLV